MSAVLEPTGGPDGAATASGAVAPYCAWCGQERAGADHTACERRLATVDPPRHCPVCARRMVVQVEPMGWTARCSRHGETTGAGGFT